nr:MAG TPA: hypothetical protein [Caudoviricetes sp.]
MNIGEPTDLVLILSKSGEKFYILSIALLRLNEKI